MNIHYCWFFFWAVLLLAPFHQWGRVNCGFTMGFCLHWVATVFSGAQVMPWELQRYPLVEDTCLTSVHACTVEGNGKAGLSRWWGWWYGMLRTGALFLLTKVTPIRTRGRLMQRLLGDCNTAQREKEDSEPEQEAKEQERSWQIGKGKEIRMHRI